MNAIAAYAFVRFKLFGRKALFVPFVILIDLTDRGAFALLMFPTTCDLRLTGVCGTTMVGLTLPFAAKAFNIYFLLSIFCS